MQIFVDFSGISARKTYFSPDHGINEVIMYIKNLSKVFLLLFICSLFSIVACDGSKFVTEVDEVTPSVGGDGSDCSDDECDADEDDEDGDGVEDDDDNCPEDDNEDQEDNDNDGDGDECDDNDDGDDFDDDDDNCQFTRNDDQDDLDEDDIGDACDDDADGDEVDDDEDNCLLLANDQTDTDEDGEGDACDSDDDDDGIDDESDAFPTDPEESADTDEDGIGDVADICPGAADDQTNSDGDSFGDACDNCVDDDNEDQADLDDDGLGDICDDDDDGDGYDEGSDDCDDTDANVNIDQDEIFDLIDNVDCDGDYDHDVSFSLSTASIEGEGSTDKLGLSVTGAGDFNGDGYDDVVAGAPGAGGSNEGQVYIFYGSSDFDSGSIDPADADIVIAGENAGDKFGWSVAAVGDVDSDGNDDLLIGAPEYDDGSSGYAGRVYLFKGSSLLGGTDELAADADAIFTGEGSNHLLGYTVAGAGNVNASGGTDILMGAYGADSYAGKVYLFYGGSGFTGEISMTSASVVFEGTVSSSERAGRAIAGAGDIDGDGYDDIMISAPYNADVASSSGKVYIFYGGLIAGTLNVADADLSFTGEASSNYAGMAIAGGQDVNADGVEDLVIGAYGYDSNTGRVYIIYGSQTRVEGDFSVDTADVIINGETTSTFTGRSITLLPDMDGDSVGEILIGAYRYNSGAGKVYYIQGSDSFDTEITLADDTVDGTLIGDAAGDSAGYALSNAGDVNGDGLVDLIIGAYGVDDSDSSANDIGMVYLLMQE
jgi:hypothetical protein